MKPLFIMKGNENLLMGFEQRYLSLIILGVENCLEEKQKENLVTGSSAKNLRRGRSEGPALGLPLRH